MLPTIEPFATGQLPLAGNNSMYWEASGTPSGKPALYLHGGPGSGLGAGYRRWFDPNAYFIISFDQRGCGRSRPRVTDPSADHPSKTTHALIWDIKTLREHLGGDQWLVTGVSW